jgi:hypothetical protein
MIIFIDDDAACGAWLARRSQAWAVEGMRNRSPKRLLLHAAGCSRLKNVLRRNAATTHGRWTACALERSQLTAWCASEYDTEPTPCPTCSAVEAPPESHHLTRLGRDVLDFVLDVAVIHLEPDARPYHLTVADVAQCLRKTSRQLSATFQRLIEEGYLTIGPSPGRSPRQGDRRHIHPTAMALRTLEYYAACDPRSVEAEIARLHAA